MQQYKAKNEESIMKWLEKSLVVAALVGWSMAFASGCATRSDEQRYAAANRYSYPPTYTYRYGQNRNQDREYEHPGNPLAHHYYD